MAPEDFISIGGFAAQVLFGVLLVFGVLGLRIYFFFRSLSRRREAARRAKAEGRFAPPSFFDGQELPAQYSAISSIGTGGAAPVSIGETILRPAIGVRLFTLGLAGVIFGFLVRPDLAPAGFHEAMLELPIPPILLQGLLLAAALWSLVYIFGFEARYNADTLIVTRLLTRREYPWKNLLWMRDDGAYDLLLIFEPGGKAKVLKHSVGVAEFRLFAERQAQLNRGRYA